MKKQSTRKLRRSSQNKNSAQLSEFSGKQKNNPPEDYADHRRTKTPRNSASSAGEKQILTKKY